MKDERILIRQHAHNTGGTKIEPPYLYSRFSMMCACKTTRQIQLSIIYTDTDKRAEKKQTPS